MSGYDRVVRILLALFLSTLSISGQFGLWGWIVSLVLLLTESLVSCPMYALLGFEARKSA